MLYRIIAILFASLTCNAVSGAECGKECSAVAAAPNAALEDVLVTGTFAPQPALTSSVSVLDAQQIQALNKTTVADLLKTLPGLLVEQQGGPGGLTAVSIRGGESNFTLVLVDGIAVNDPSNFRGGSFDFANLNPNSVERIEVVRGAQSAIYGSDALAGVINIITRRPQQGHQQDVYAEAGQDDYSDVGASALGSVGDFNYVVGVAHRDDGEPTPGSTRDTDSANLRLGWQPSTAQAFGVSYRYLDGKRGSYPEQGGGPRFSQNDALDHSDYTQEILAADWGAQWSSLWRSTVTGSRFEQDEHYRSPGIAPYLEVPPNAADTDFTRDQLRWVNTLQLAPANTANLGAEYRHEDGKSVGYLEFFGARMPTDFELDRDTRSLFADISATPLADLLLHTQPALRRSRGFRQRDLGAGRRQIYRGRGRHPRRELGRGVQTAELFRAGPRAVGNPDLQPEQGESWDLGASWQASDALVLGATGFENDFRDLVDFDNETFAMSIASACRPAASSCRRTGKHCPR
jgi:vitamin B12 transporter